MFNIVKSIYQKGDILGEYEQFQAIYILGFISKDKDLLDYLPNLVSYLFNINATHFIYLLYFSLPKKYNIPYCKTEKPKEEKESELMINLSKKFYWSKKEIEMYKELINGR